MIDLFDDLVWRGLIHQATDEAHLAQWLRSGSRTLYVGFDPTASSLHVGSLLPLMMLRRFQKAGHKPIALVGGATGMIGDPSGKSEERPMREAAEIAANARLIEAQVRRVAASALGEEAAARFIVRDNIDWLGPVQLIDFLRDVGKHFTVNWMMQKDSVKSRMEGGISFTEFSYMLLQAYDFLKLHERDGVTLQLGGSDQYGNITAGTELVRRAARAARRMGSPSRC